MHRAILVLLVLLVLLVVCGCNTKSGEERFCELARAQRTYDPQRPALCHETYQKRTPAERKCLDTCLDKTQNAGPCDEQCGGVVAPSSGRFK